MTAGSLDDSKRYHQGLLARLLISARAEKRAPNYPSRTKMAQPRDPGPPIVPHYPACHSYSETVLVRAENPYCSAQGFRSYSALQLHEEAKGRHSPALDAVAYPSIASWSPTAVEVWAMTPAGNSSTHRALQWIPVMR